MDHEEWKPQISQQIARLSLISPIPCSLSVPQLLTANIAKFARFADTWCESREINRIRTSFNKSSIFLFRTLVGRDPAPCLRELHESRGLELTFAKPPLLYSLHNILTLYILLQDNSLQFKATIYQCVVTRDKDELILIFKMLTFPTLGLLLRHKQSKFRKNNFIFVILAYSRSCTCLCFQISSSIGEVVTSPRRLCWRLATNTTRCTPFW